MTYSNQKIAHTLAYCAVAVSFMVAAGQYLTSIPAIREYFDALGPESYWANRLDAVLYLGSTGLWFGALMKFVAVYFFTSSEAGKYAVGRLLLWLTMIPHAVSIVTVLSLTPSDWSHTVLHVLAITFVTAALLLKKPAQA